MKEVLNTMVQAVGDQAIALGAVSDGLMTLKRTLARQFPDIAEELKEQMAEEQERSRKDVYELQVSLAKVREAIARLPEITAPKEKVERKPRLSTQSKARVGARKAGARR